MKKRDKILIIVLSIIAVILIGVAAGIGLHSMSGDAYMNRIKKAEACMDKGDYDQAIAIFQKAMEEDASRSEAYAGLAKVYVKRNYLNLAQDILMNGIERTNEKNLQNYYVELFPNNPLPGQEGNTDIEEMKGISEIAVDQKGGASGELNTALLQFISKANFGAYVSKYGVSDAGHSGNNYSYTVNNIGVVLNYSNTGSRNVINDKTGEPYREFYPTSLSFRNLGLVFGTFEAKTISLNQIRKITGVKILSEDSSQVVIQAYGCKLTIDLNSDGTFSPDSKNTVEITPVEVEEKEHILSGQIIDSATGKGVGQVEIHAFSLDDDDAKPVIGETDKDGAYSIEIGEGEFRVTLEKEGYIEGEYTVTVYSSTKEVTENFTLTQELDDDVIRIVLSWESSPKDLDSYLRGTAGDGTQIMTSFWRKVEKNKSGDIVAELDLDDTNGEGPETTTVYDMNGVFEFVVVDFNHTGTMGAMGAEVEVFKGNSRIESISINPDVDNQWSVLRIDHGEVSIENRAINERTNHSTK